MQKLHEQYIINESGEKTAVVLPLVEFEELIEDLHDLAIIAERKDEAVLSLKDLKNDLKKNGIL